MNKGIAPMGQHDKPPPHQWDTGQRLLGPGARFAVAGGHAMGSRMGSSKSPCRTSYLSSIETIALNCLVLPTDKIGDGHQFA